MRGKEFAKRHWRPIAYVLVGLALLGSQLLFGLWVGFLLGRYGRKFQLKLSKKEKPAESPKVGAELKRTSKRVR